MSPSARKKTALAIVTVCSLVAGYGLFLFVNLARSFAQIPTVAEMRRAVPAYSSAKTLHDRFGEPSSTSGSGFNEYWSYRCRDGVVLFDVQFGQVTGVTWRQY